MGEKTGKTVSSVWRTLCIVTALGVAAAMGLFAYKLFEDPPYNALFDEYPPGSTHSDLKVVQPTAPRPNIILILCDDLGYRDLGCYGTDVIQTPNIDRLVASGMRFDNFYANCPVCSPTRRSESR